MRTNKPEDHWHGLNFETELPPEARREILRPRPKKRFRWGAGWLFPSLLLVGIGVLMGFLGAPVKPGEAFTVPAPTMAPSATPAATPAPPRAQPPGPRPDARNLADQAPRAIRVWPYGVYHWEHLPDGTPVWLRHLGIKNSFEALPTRPRIGDCWEIPESGNCWVWMIPAGWTRGAWVDPISYD